MKLPSERLSARQRTSIIEVLESLDCAVIYLFGSFGGPAARPESDIDIAFLSLRPIGPVEVFDLANTLAERLGKSVDLIDLRLASTVLRKEVLRTGTALDIRDPSTRQDFEMRTLADYARLNEERHSVLTR